MDRFQINTRLHRPAFIAQMGHESGQFRYVKELGGDQYLSKYNTGTQAKRLGKPEAVGEGQKYRGRGLIQIARHDNYLACSKALFGGDRLLRWSNETRSLLKQTKLRLVGRRAYSRPSG